jgi:hypothetical protein
MMLTLVIVALLVCMGACFALGYEFRQAEPAPPPVSLADRLDRNYQKAMPNKKVSIPAQRESSEQLTLEDA